MGTQEYSFSSKKDDIKSKQAILAVEEKADVELIEKFLKTIRYRVLGKSTDNREVLELIRKHKTGLLFLDFDITELGTNAVLDKVKVNNPKMKMIILSKQLNKEQITDAKARGVAGFLAKPLTPDPVKKLLTKLM